MQMTGGSSPSDGFQGADSTFYRTTLNLDTPSGHDVSLSFSLNAVGQSAGGAAPFRALLFVNGYQYGRFNPHIRATNPYPVPPGILNHGGENTIAVAVWAQTKEGAAVDLSVNVAYVVQSSLNVKFDSEYLRPGWSSERLEYA
jgi:hypothetical protein